MDNVMDTAEELLESHNSGHKDFSGMKGSYLSVDQ